MEPSIENYIKNMVRDAILHLQFQNDRQTYVIANWKMNKTIAEATEFFQTLKGRQDVNIVVCPPAPLLYPVQLLIKQSKKPIGLGGQNVHWEKKGAYTGEISTEMLKDVGCEYAIIGHSERRHYFSEDDATINRKVKKAIRAGLIPILCVGETLEEKNLLQTEQVLYRQLFGALKDIEMSQLIIAYEPVWAIGTGQSATADLAEQTHAYIRSVLKQLVGHRAENISILYGGSVNGENAADFRSMPNIDGVLVGGASLNAASFDEIIDVFAKGEPNK